MKQTAVSPEETEDALVALLEIENPVDLLDHDWTANEIVDTLRNFNFASLSPEVLAVATLEASIIPNGVPRRLDEVKLKVRGEVWYIHKTDSDPFPSVPHAHNYDSGHTMDLGTGELYLGRRLVGKISGRDLIDFRQRPELRDLQLPALAV
jgi:hypothetical protein